MTVDTRPDILRRKYRIRNDLTRCLLCEFVCTTILLFGGTSVVAQAILGGGKFNEFISITLGWGLSLIFAVQLGQRISGSHLNPAVSLFLFSFGQLSPIRLLLYSLVQIAGGFFGAMLTFIMYYDAIEDFDKGTRYVSGPLRTANIFATYPAPYLSTIGGLVDQIFGTMMLCIFVGLITDRRNRIPAWAQPSLIGVCLILIGMAWGMNSGYAINPARDFGPRLFTLIAGYGWKVISYRNYKWFWIPIIGPLIGGVMGSWLYQFLIGIHIPSDIDDLEEEMRRIQEDKTHQAVVIQDTDTPQSSVHKGHSMDSRML